MPQEHEHPTGTEQLTAAQQALYERVYTEGEVRLNGRGHALAKRLADAGLVEVEVVWHVSKAHTRTVIVRPIYGSVIEEPPATGEEVTDAPRT